MKKVLVLAVVLFLMSIGISKADNSLSSTFYASSNYIFRAMSYNSQGTLYQAQGSPVIEASVDYLHTDAVYTGSSLGASFFTGPADTFNTESNAMEKDVEEDIFLTLNKPITSDFTVGIGYNYYACLLKTLIMICQMICFHCKLEDAEFYIQLCG